MATRQQVQNGHSDRDSIRDLRKDHRLRTIGHVRIDFNATIHGSGMKNHDRSAGRVTFRQRVEDPREIKPYRDIVKKLYSSTEEGQ